MIPITPDLAIPEAELEFTAVRSSGPGGQNVNKVSTRVMLRFDVVNSPTLSGWHKQRLLVRLRTRITKEGVLVITAQEHRTQPANRAAAVDRFSELLRDAFRILPVRKKTRVPRGSKARRLESKRLRSRIKQLRTRNIRPDEP